MQKYGKKILTNIKSFRLDTMEISGSLGDMGLYIPLVTALVSINGMDITSVLFFSGLFNILTGVLFGIPMCVQPMKAIATIAIVEGLTVNQILAAGIVTGFIILIVGITNIIDFIRKHIPFVIVRGIQVALGLKLLMKGIEMIKSTNTWFGYDSFLIGITCAIIIIIMFAYSKVPAALFIFILGLFLIGINNHEIISNISISAFSLSVIDITKQNFYTGFFKAAVPQIPLTLFNSVIAVCALSGELFPKNRASEKEVTISIGIMNIIGCFFGAMPSCHGSGGLAGQYRYGARTGGRMLFLGSVKIMFAVLFGSALVPVFAAYPKSILGALLFFTGMELALMIKDVVSKRDLFIVFATIAGILVINTAAGVIIGLACLYLVPIGWLLPSEKYKKEINEIQKNKGMSKLTDNFQADKKID